MLKVVAVVWVALAVAAGLVLWRYEPEGMMKWALLAVALPPAYLLMQGVAELMAAAYQALPGVRHGNEFVERKTRGRSVSGLRVLWYVFTSLVAVAIFIAGTWMVRNYS